jgi:putative flippase GtrA
MMPRGSFARFCVVGIINTAIDVPIFVALHSAGLSVLAANICSTSLALLASLILNYRYTFQGKSQGKSLSPARIVVYFAVTLVGIWILQPLVITALLALNNQLHATSPLTNFSGHASQVNSLLAKLGSLAVSLVWNFSWYSRVVFRGSDTTVTNPENVAI